MSAKKIMVCLMVLLLLVGCGKKNVRWQEAYDLGVKYLSDGHYNAALEQFTLAIEIDPRNPKGYTGRADVYIEAARLVYAENPEDERVTRYLDFAQAEYARAQELDASIVMPTADWFVPQPAAVEPENRQAESAEMPEIGEPELSRIRNMISGKWSLASTTNHQYYLEFMPDGTLTLSVGWCQKHLFGQYAGNYMVFPSTDPDIFEMQIRLQIAGGPGFGHDFFQPDVDEVFDVHYVPQDEYEASLELHHEFDDFTLFETTGPWSQGCWSFGPSNLNEYDIERENYNICHNQAEELVRARLGMPVHGINIYADEYYLFGKQLWKITTFDMETMTFEFFSRGKSHSFNREECIYVNLDTGEVLFYEEIPEPYR